MLEFKTCLIIGTRTNKEHGNRCFTLPRPGKPKLHFTQKKTTLYETITFIKHEFYDIHVKYQQNRMH